MYRLLVVDDEPEVVEGVLDILDELPKDDFEFCTAYSAAEALQQLSHVRIDIVLTDIHMPQMDGLAMYEEIKKRWPRCKVIFISGVRDFDTVYRSIQNRDVRYLTKMESDQKIRQTVLDVVREIEQNTLLNDAIQQAKQYYTQALPLLRRQYLTSLLEGTCPPQEIAQDIFDEFNIPLKIQNPAFLFGLCLDPPASGEAYPSRTNEKYLLYSLMAVCEDTIKDFTSRYCCYMEHPFLLWMLQLPRHTELPDTSQVFDAIFEQIQKGCRSNLGRKVSIAYSHGPLLFSSLSAAYSDIRQTLGYGQNHFAEGIWDTSLQQVPEPGGEVPDARVLLRNFSSLENSLELGKGDEYHAVFNEMTDCLRALPKSRNVPSLEVYYNVATLLLKYINLWELTEPVEKAYPLEKLLHPDRFASWTEAVDYLSGLSNNVMELRSQKESERFLDAIVTVKEYIRDHLDGDLSLMSLANVVHLHPAYLSRLFKETTGQNLYRYILELRMELAKHLLCSSNEKVHVIAQKTGYVTTQTFNRAFKKYTGATPHEYRIQKSEPGPSGRQ